MTQIAAITKALLDGQVLSIMTGFSRFACSNLPREISRSIEQKFDVQVSRERVDFTSKYGQSGYYYRYRLNRTPYNAEGIEKMKAYVAEHSGPSDTTQTTIVKEHTRNLKKPSTPSQLNRLF